MALINCPTCGQQVSEKATTCVHCGSVLKTESIFEKTCSECGAKLSLGATECSVCGCPVETEEKSDPQKVEVTNVKLTLDDKKKKTIKIVIAILHSLKESRHPKNSRPLSCSASICFRVTMWRCPPRK